MIRATSTNCSPMKPAVSFKRADNLAAATDLLEKANNEGLSEDLFNDIKSQADGMKNGPMKVFAEIAAIAGAAWAATKVGAGKAMKAVTKNKAIGEHIMKPTVLFVGKRLNSLSVKFAKGAEELKDKKGIKPFFTKQANRLMEKVEAYKNRGIEKTAEELEKQISKFETVILKKIKKTNAGKVAGEEELKTILQARLKDNKEYQDLLQAKQFLPDKNLVDKTIENVAAIGSGTGAAIYANGDPDGNGKSRVQDHQESA